jgi:genome maintenance exonuclease 1
MPQKFTYSSKTKQYFASELAITGMGEQMLTRYSPQLVWRDRQCYYVSPQGARLPSISAILTATKPAKEWAILKAWRKRVGEAEARRISKASRKRGKELHKRIESYLLGKSLSLCPANLVPWRNSIYPLLQQLTDVQLVEGALFHHELRYAGTVDAIAGHGNRGWCLWEWKTATSLQKNEYMAGYKLQVAALWGATLETYGVQLEQAAVVIALPDEEVQVVWLEQEELTEWWGLWVERVRQYQGVNHI